MLFFRKRMPLELIIKKITVVAGGSFHFFLSVQQDDNPQTITF